MLQYIFYSILGLRSICECVNGFEDNGDATQWGELCQKTDRWGDAWLSVQTPGGPGQPMCTLVTSRQVRKRCLESGQLGARNLTCDARDHKQKIQAATPSQPPSSNSTIPFFGADCGRRLDAEERDIYINRTSCGGSTSLAE